MDVERGDGAAEARAATPARARVAACVAGVAAVALLSVAAIGASSASAPLGAPMATAGVPPLLPLHRQPPLGAPSEATVQNPALERLFRLGAERLMGGAGPLGEPAEEPAVDDDDDLREFDEREEDAEEDAEEDSSESSESSSEGDADARRFARRNEDFERARALIPPGMDERANDEALDALAAQREVSREARAVARAQEERREFMQKQREYVAAAKAKRQAAEEEGDDEEEKKPPMAKLGEENEQPESPEAANEEGAAEAGAGAEAGADAEAGDAADANDAAAESEGSEEGSEESEASEASEESEPSEPSDASEPSDDSEDDAAASEASEDSAASDASADASDDSSSLPPPGATAEGNPLFDDVLDDSQEALRAAGYEADALAEVAGEDAAAAASAYITDAALKRQPARDWSGDAPMAEVGMSDARNDLLAVAMRDDPITNKYLPPTLLGYDFYADDWWHHPVEDRGYKNSFKVCLDQGAGSWDSAFAEGLGNLFRAGVCFHEVTEGPCDEADVVIFNQAVVLWGGGYRDPANGGAITFPPKKHENQVYMYFAHEAAGTFGWELRDPAVVKQVDYLAYFDRENAAVWFPFGPTLRSMLRDFKFFQRPRQNRIPGVAWLAIDCLPLRARVLQGIAEHFPVFSLGTCQNNAAAPAGLPGRGAGDAQFQNLMSNYMFYYAVENGGQCRGYATEKVWMALSRGSVPLYFGSEDVVAMMPTPESFVDLKKFDSPEALAARLREIATNDEAYWEVHKWRYQDPTTWSPGFRQLIRTMSTDIKYGVCHALQKGPTMYPEPKAQGECEYDFDVLGRRVDAWPDRGGIAPPEKHLIKTCEHAGEKCWAFRELP